MSTMFLAEFHTDARQTGRRGHRFTGWNGICKS